MISRFPEIILSRGCLFFFCQQRLTRFRQRISLDRSYNYSSILAKTEKQLKKAKELTDTMGEQDDLENRLANSSLAGSSTEVSGISMEGVAEKVGGAEVEGDMFRNIWHEYLFIFVVTSAQLITVSSNATTAICY